MTWQYDSETRMWYTMRRGKIVYWILLVGMDDGHEYRPHVPSGFPQPRTQWVQLPPCQTLEEAKRAVLTKPTTVER